MNSQFLNQIGLGNLDTGIVLLVLLVFIVILFTLVIIQIVAATKMKKKYIKFMQGKDANSLEKDIIGLYEDNKFIKNAMDKHKKDIRILYKKAEKSFQKCGLIKYDAFRHMGGQLSFSLALLDEMNDGFIINSVHSTEGCYSYTKEVEHGECSLLLSEEEKKALDKAIGSK